MVLGNSIGPIPFSIYLKADWKASGFRDSGVGFQGSRGLGLGMRVWGLGFRDEGLVGVCGLGMGV